MTETGAAFSHETGNSPEILAQELAARVDRGLHELGVPPRDGRAWGWCNFVPDAVNYCAIQDGQEKGYEVKAAAYQVRDLHLVAAGKSVVGDITSKLPDWWRLPPDSPARVEVEARIRDYSADPEVARIREATFSHGFNIVDINGSPFLVDLTFSQFMGPDGTLTQGGDEKSSGIPTDHPLAQQILHDGFIPLTDENLQTYMRFLCVDQPSYLPQVTTDLLERVTPLPFAMNDNELLDRIPPAYQQPDASSR